MKKIICLLKEHKWSQWYNWVRGDKQYRYCERCGKQQFRLYKLEQIPDKDEEEDELDKEVEKMKGRVEMVRLEDLDDLKSGCAWVGCQETCPVPKGSDAVDSLPEGWRFLVVAKGSLFNPKNLLAADVDGVLCPKHYKELLSLLKIGGIKE